MPEDNLSTTQARISELLRLRMVAESGEDVLAYIEERLEQLFPAEYKEYRQRWLALPQDRRPGSLLDYLRWQALFIDLEEQAYLADRLEMSAPGTVDDDLLAVLERRNAGAVPYHTSLGVVATGEHERYKDEYVTMSSVCRRAEDLGYTARDIVHKLSDGEPDRPNEPYNAAWVTVRFGGRKYLHGSIMDNLEITLAEVTGH